MRLALPLFALIAALPIAAACTGSEGSGAGGSTAATGSTGSSTHVVKKSDAGPIDDDDAGHVVKSTSAGW
jgi:hypothetical protein